MSKRTRKRTWTPSDSVAYLAKAKLPKTGTGCGGWPELLVEYWVNGPPPDDDAVLARIAGLTPERWARLRPILLGLFEVRDGRWRNAGLDDARERAGQRGA